MIRLLATALLFAILLGVPGSTGIGAPPANAQPPRTASAADLAPKTRCAYTTVTADLLAQVTLTEWSGWVRKLSGAEPISSGGPTITTRYSPTLFNGGSPAFDFVKNTVAAWYPGQVEEFSYPAPYSYAGQTWKNLILTIPGSTNPENIVLLTAHLDSTSYYYNNAPGANDNATGSATLLEAARVLQGKSLPNTLRIIWFTGEEQGLRGSQAYASSVASWEGVIGVVNVDMIGYDGKGDRCLELHVGRLPQSRMVGSCFVEAIGAYDLDLKYDFLTSTAISASDHASFWAKGVGAVEVLENYRDDRMPNGCSGSNSNPYYHQPTDTFENLSLPYSFDVARAALATTFSLARLPTANTSEFFEWYRFPVIIK